MPRRLPVRGPFLMEIAMKRVLLLVLGSLLLALPVSGSQYYVSPAGNDNNSGTSPSSTWATISKVNNFVLMAAILFPFKEARPSRAVWCLIPAQYKILQRLLRLP